MEHAGNRLNKIQATAHHPDNYGSGDGGETNAYNDVSTEFHIYSVVWTEKGITFLIDDEPFHIVGNACSLPYNWNFFVIVNIAMGGTFGGNVPSDFSSDIMEVDYVRVYQ
jgi:beta-glucanase (GH16 family)